MQNKLFETAYRLFAKFSIKPLKRRLPVYVLGLTILMIWGIKGLMLTFFLILAFCAGWFGKTLRAAVADYRLARRLDRVYFTQLEYDTMKRERDMALEAYRAVRDGGRGPKAAPMPPRSPAPHTPTYDPDQIREFVMQMEMEGSK